MAIASINGLYRAVDLTGRVALTALCLAVMAAFAVAILAFGPARFGRWTYHLMTETAGPT
jgi:hypothetical protein